MNEISYHRPFFSLHENGLIKVSGVLFAPVYCIKEIGLDGRVGNYVPDNDTSFLVLITALLAVLTFRFSNFLFFFIFLVLLRSLSVYI